jgi:hypothetical protein
MNMSNAGAWIITLSTLIVAELLGFFVRSVTGSVHAGHTITIAIVCLVLYCASRAVFTEVSDKLTLKEKMGADLDSIEARAQAIQEMYDRDRRELQATYAQQLNELKDKRDEVERILAQHQLECFQPNARH